MKCSTDRVRCSFENSVREVFRKVKRLSEKNPKIYLLQTFVQTVVVDIFQAFLTIQLKKFATESRHKSNKPN